MISSIVMVSGAPDAHTYKYWACIYVLRVIRYSPGGTRKEKASRARQALADGVARPSRGPGGSGRALRILAWLRSAPDGVEVGGRQRVLRRLGGAGGAAGRLADRSGLVRPQPVVEKLVQLLGAGLRLLPERGGGLRAHRTGIRLTRAEPAHVGHRGARCRNGFRGADLGRGRGRMLVAARQQNGDDRQPECHFDQESHEPVPVLRRLLFCRTRDHASKRG